MPRSFPIFAAILTTATLASTLCPAPARADATPPSMTRVVDLEIVDTPRAGAARVLHHTLSVVDERGWATLKSDVGSDHLLLRARSDRDRNGAVVFGIEVRRNEDISLEQSALFAAGKRIVLARVEHADGLVTEVAILAR